MGGSQSEQVGGNDELHLAEGRLHVRGDRGQQRHGDRDAEGRQAAGGAKQPDGGRSDVSRGHEADGSAGKTITSTFFDLKNELKIY